MERLQRSAIVLLLIESLREKGNWCGETHIQKCTYFLQELLDVPMGFQFILYKHGPYSFDLSDELLAMRGNGILQIELRPPYGPSISPGPRSNQLKSLFSETLKKHVERVKFVAEELSGYKVADLERIATAVYVILNQGPRSDGRSSQAAYINEVKPHISLDAALNSLESADRIREKAGKLVGTR